MHSQCRHFVVMESLFFNSESIHEKYDLKGSWVDRRRHVGATYLDLDMRRKLLLPTPVGAELLRQCTLDVALLRGLNIMDYSLLLGVHVAADGVDVAANIAESTRGVSAGSDGDKTVRGCFVARGRVVGAHASAGFAFAHTRKLLIPNRREREMTCPSATIRAVRVFFRFRGPRKDPAIARSRPSQPCSARDEFSG